MNELPSTHEGDEQQVARLILRKEGNWQEETHLLDLVAAGLEQLGYGMDGVLFCGYGAGPNIEDQPRQETYAVTSEEWQDALKYYNEFASPLFYAGTACGTVKTAKPTIGVYRADLLQLSPGEPDIYQSRVLGAAVQSAEICRFDVSDWV